jgi:uncharacterized protein (TIGR03066 family)
MRGFVTALIWFCAAGVASAKDEKAKDDPKAAVVGKWESQGEDRKPLEFFEDGTAKIGFVKKDGKWLIAEGTYTVSDAGRVAFKGGHDGVTLGLYWTLKDGVLVSPGPPMPMLRFVKVKEEKKKGDDKK